MNNKQALIKKAVEDCFSKAEQIYGKTFNKPLVKFDIRGNNIAGQVVYSKNVVRFNQKYIDMYKQGRGSFKKPNYIK